MNDYARNLDTYGDGDTGPDLYAACVAALVRMESGVECNAPEVALLRAALSRASGKQTISGLGPSEMRARKEPYLYATDEPGEGSGA